MSELHEWVRRQKEKGYSAQRLKEHLKSKGHSKHSIKIVDEIYTGTYDVKRFGSWFFLLVVAMVVINAAIVFFAMQNSGSSEDVPHPLLVGYTQTETYRGVVSIIEDDAITINSNGVLLPLVIESPFESYSTDNETIVPIEQSELQVGDTVQATAFVTKEGSKIIQDIIAYR